MYTCIEGVGAKKASGGQLKERFPVVNLQHGPWHTSFTSCNIGTGTHQKVRMKFGSTGGC